MPQRRGVWSLYLRPSSSVAQQQSTIDALDVDRERQAWELHERLLGLWHDLLKALKADRSSWLESRTWLISSIAALPHVSGAARAACLGLYLPSGVLPADLEERVRRDQDRGQCSERDRHVRGKGSESAGASLQSLAGGKGHEEGEAGLAEEVQHALMELLCEQYRPQVAELLTDCPHLFHSFFQGSPERIRLWFSHFSMEGLPRFKYGARALGQYVLAARDEVWHRLVWTGRHPQAPVTVATKTHYLCELDVVASVENLLAGADLRGEGGRGREGRGSGRRSKHRGSSRESRDSSDSSRSRSRGRGTRRSNSRSNSESRSRSRSRSRLRGRVRDRGEEAASGAGCGLLSSEQWRDCLASGEFLDLDRTWFSKELVALLDAPSDVGRRLRLLLREYLLQGPAGSWGLLCRRLLHRLPDGKLLALLRGVAQEQWQGMEEQERCWEDGEGRRRREAERRSDVRGRDDRGRYGGRSRSRGREGRYREGTQGEEQGWPLKGSDGRGRMHSRGYEERQRVRSRSRSRGKEEGYSRRGRSRSRDGSQGYHRTVRQRSRSRDPGRRRDMEQARERRFESREERMLREGEKQSTGTLGGLQLTLEHVCGGGWSDLSGLVFWSGTAILCSMPLSGEGSVHGGDGRDDLGRRPEADRRRHQPEARSSGRGGEADGIDWEGLDQVVLLHALCCCRSQLWRLLCEESPTDPLEGKKDNSASSSDEAEAPTTTAKLVRSIMGAMAELHGPSARHLPQAHRHLISLARSSLLGQSVLPPQSLPAPPRRSSSAQEAATCHAETPLPLQLQPAWARCLLALEMWSLRAALAMAEEGRLPKQLVQGETVGAGTMDTDSTAGEADSAAAAGPAADSTAGALASAASSAGVEGLRCERLSAGQGPFTSQAGAPPTTCPGSAIATGGHLPSAPVYELLEGSSDKESDDRSSDSDSSSSSSRGSGSDSGSGVSSGRHRGRKHRRKGKGKKRRKAKKRRRRTSKGHRVAKHRGPGSMHSDGGDGEDGSKGRAKGSGALAPPEGESGPKAAGSAVVAAFRVQLPGYTFGSHGTQPAVAPNGLVAVGTAWEAADLLACFACKAWLVVSPCL